MRQGQAKSEKIYNADIGRERENKSDRYKHRERVKIRKVERE